MNTEFKRTTGLHLTTGLHTTTVLHLTGSPESQFFNDLSCLYARDCLAATEDPQRYRFLIAHIGTDGQWCFPTRLTAEEVGRAKKWSRRSALEILSDQSIDVAVPQMFCHAGMTEYRRLIARLQIPMVGNPADVMAIAIDKGQTRDKVAEHGVMIPSGQIVQRGQTVKLGPPVVVKPIHADNSTGVSLVRAAVEMPTALDRAFEHSREVLVEEYIELGREVRCGVLELDGKLRYLPLQEYRMDKTAQPIRNRESKLTKDADGNLDLTSKHDPQSWIVDTSDPIGATVWEAAQRCHQALGCRDYSLFDFRIDATGKPWFLEAGLYCSFAPNSILSAMAEADGMPLKQFFQRMVDQAIARGAPSALEPSALTAGPTGS